MSFWESASAAIAFIIAFTLLQHALGIEPGALGAIVGGVCAFLIYQQLRDAR